MSLVAAAAPPPPPPPGRSQGRWALEWAYLWLLWAEDWLPRASALIVRLMDEEASPEALGVAVAARNALAARAREAETLVCFL